MCATRNENEYKNNFAVRSVSIWHRELQEWERDTRRHSNAKLYILYYNSFTYVNRFETVVHTTRLTVRTQCSSASSCQCQMWHINLRLMPIAHNLVFHFVYIAVFPLKIKCTEKLHVFVLQFTTELKCSPHIDTHIAKPDSINIQCKYIKSVCA